MIHYDDDEHLRRLADGSLRPPARRSDRRGSDVVDEVIEASTEQGRSIVGSVDPIVVIDGAQNTYFGPVLSPALTGDEALRLWDALVVLGSLPGSTRLRGREVARSRGRGPNSCSTAIRLGADSTAER